MVAVREHRSSGLMVIADDGTGFWLPHGEISYESGFNPKDVETIRRGYPLGHRVRVVTVGMAASERNLSVVSVAAAVYDPWEEEVPSWKTSGSHKIMVVTDTSHEDQFRGRIQPGVEARVSRQDWEAALGQRATAPFFLPQVGDRLAGVVVDTDTDKRVVHVSVAALFRDFQPGEEAKKLTVIPRVRLDSASALALLSDTPDSELRTLVEAQEAYSSAGEAPATVPPFRRILILDDMAEVAECLAANLRASGFKRVDACSRMAQAREILGISKNRTTGSVQVEDHEAGDEYEDVGAAIIDVHLEMDEEYAEYGGIAFAKEIQDAYPSCRIILISGETVGEEATKTKMAIVGGLVISGYVFKPITGTELLRALNEAKVGSARRALDILRDQLSPCQTSPSDHAHSTRIINALPETMHEVLKDLALRLKRHHGSNPDSVVLFSMHPATYEVGVVADWGVPMANMGRFGCRLRYSPVGDVCLYAKGDAARWYDADVGRLFGKHRYLLYAYSKPESSCSTCRGRHGGRVACSKHRYKSCMAVPVSGGPGNPLAYGLFAISMRSHAFDGDSVLIEMDLAATKISMALREFHEIHAEEEDFSFLMTGRSACSLGHDLCNFLQHGIEINTALAVVEKIRSQRASNDDVRELRDVLQRTQSQLNFALEISKNFRDLSRSDAEVQTTVPFEEIIQAKDGARKAAHPEIVKNKAEVFQPDMTGCGDHAPLVRVRRNAMVRVFQNLLNNSAQQIGAMGILPGAIRIDVSVKTPKREGHSEKEMLCVDIVDTGPGIHWASREQIFEPRVTTKPNGSGMGLYIVRQEVNRTGGFIEVAESILGLGTKMRVWLPLSNDSPSTRTTSGE
jgi:signal transduction histidine kinase/CheY-like chemotaxis protein